MSAMSMYKLASAKTLADAMSIATTERDRAKFQLLYYTTPAASWLSSSVEKAREAQAEVEKWDRVIAASTAPIEEAKLAYHKAVADVCAIEALIPQALTDADRLTLNARLSAARIAAADVLSALNYRMHQSPASCSDVTSVTGTVAGAIGSSPTLALGVLALLGGAIYVATRKAAR